MTKTGSTKKSMKNIQLIVISIAIATAGLFTGCDFYADRVESAELSKIEAERELDITQSEIQGEIQIFRREMADKIMENNRSVADIKRKINSGDRWSAAKIDRKINRGDSSVRVTQEARILDLQLENREMKRSIDNYSDLSRYNWDTFKKEFKEDIEELGISFNTFFENSDVAK